MDKETLRNAAFPEQDDALFNKKVTPVAVPQHEIGIDLDNRVLDNIVDTMETSQFDINAINSFTQVSRSRDEIYNTLDDMGDDSIIAAVLETYAEDATETNDAGAIVWAESNDSEALKFVTYLLNALNVDKNVYKWTYSLCKYGDVYLRLYRESEYDDLLFDHSADGKNGSKQSLNEDVKIKAYSKHDNYVHYLEQCPNPAQVFELTRFGKTAAYVKTDVASTRVKADSASSLSFMNKYSFNKNDVELYPPTEFVHGCLEDNSSRTPEEVELFVSPEKSINYSVKRGQSLLYSTYKIWRQLMLLENSVLLNRVTQSSIVRVIGVEVGDMPKENVQPHLMNVKQLIEQKAALDVGKSMGEYSNPGPVINNVYIPTRNNQGVITTQQIGGDVKIGDLADLDYYQDKFFGNLRVPKQYFGVTDDGAGFSGGQSLSIISSRYAKMIKRIQNTIVQMLTDAINLILIDTGNDAYINKFTLKMQSPTTQEEVDRRDNLSNKVGLVRDIMDTLGDIENVTTKLKILKSLLSNTISDADVIQLIQEEIDELEAQLETSETDDAPTDEFGDDELLDFSGGGASDTGFDLGADLGGGEEPLDTAEGETETVDDVLPTPAELDVGDVSDSTNPALEG